MASLFDAPARGDRGPRREILTVSALNAVVRTLLEEGLPAVWVEGEISNLRRYPSGHTYFTLKDETAQVSAVLFRGHAAALRFRPEDGLKVLVHGRVGLYEARGSYQVVVERMEPAGLGALQLALEQLKARLLAEGLLDPARKRPLPLLPRRIGIVTSPAGAALRDILRVLERRFAQVGVVIGPARVQGEGAAEEIARALAALDRLGGLDVIIVARGGGSIEDLWAFNEEIVARAIAASRTPVISAVGHEIDVTLADLVADLRAPTPSAAAEMVIVSRAEIAARLSGLRTRLRSAARIVVGEGRRRLERSGAAGAFAAVTTRLRQAIQRVDDLGGRMRARLDARLVADGHRLALLSQRLSPARLAERVDGRRARIAEVEARARAAAAGRLRSGRERCAALAGRLEALSPLAVLGRGYAICCDGASGAILKDAAAVAPGAEVRVRLHRGRLACEVKEVEDVTRDETL
jgi:exodeoxyribonuclease VII large subunit